MGKNAKLRIAGDFSCCLIFIFTAFCWKVNEGRHLLTENQDSCVKNNLKKEMGGEGKMWTIIVKCSPTSLLAVFWFKIRLESASIYLSNPHTFQNHFYFHRNGTYIRTCMRYLVESHKRSDCLYRNATPCALFIV